MVRRLVVATGVLAGVVLLLVAAGAWLRPAGEPPRPNVLLVSIDSLRADHVHAYGYPRETTPTIDALGREGVLFRSAISASSWTVPAHVTMLTGLTLREHGVVTVKLRLHERAVTLAEALRDAGYATAGFVSGPTVRHIYGLAQGFDLYDDETVAQQDNFLSQKGITSPGVTKLAIDWLERWSATSPRRPFFVFLHLWDVHYDYEPPPPYDSMFDPDYEGDLTSHNFETGPRIQPDMPVRDLEHLIALYDGEVRFTDEHLGGVIEKLRALGVLDDTIVAVTSDHGEEFFEHGKKGHYKALYEESIRVPLVIRYPRRVAAGRVIEEQVRLADVAPTILGLAGVAAPPGFASQAGPAAHRAYDLSPWLGEESPPEPFPELIAVSELSIFGYHVALRTNRHKLIRYPRGARELFDLVADPGEKRNLYDAPEAAAERRRLEATLDRWIASLKGVPKLAESFEPNAKQTERLRALGYVD